MKKLIARYIKKPTPANAHRVASYWVQHPFSGMLLTNAELAALQQCLAMKNAR